jgi:hypothetical protein
VIAGLVVALIAGAIGLIRWRLPGALESADALVTSGDPAVVVGGVVGVLGALILAVWKLPQYQLRKSRKQLSPKDALDAENNFRTTLAQIIAGLAAIVGLYFAWQQLTDTRKTTQDNLAVTRQGQITDRFTRAIDQIGSENDDKTPKIETRIGGIYALERIARDSLADQEDPNARQNQKVVMEILTAYVRQNAPWPGSSQCDLTTGSPTATAPGSPTPAPTTGSPTVIAPTPASPTLREPRADVLAALVVLGRNEWFSNSPLSPSPTATTSSPIAAPTATAIPSPIATPTDIAAYTWNVDRTDLHGLNLVGLHLPGLSLYCAELDRVKFSGAYLVGASLNRAQLVDAQFPGAHLEGAHLVDTNLDHANFGDARLDGVYFNNANLPNANFIGAHLEGATLVGVKGLMRQQVEQACFDGHTTWPPDFQAPPPAAGCTP